MKFLKDRFKSFFSIMLVAMALVSFSSCSNTGKGMQQDTERNVDKAGDAAEDAGDEIEEETDELDNN